MIVEFFVNVCYEFVEICVNMLGALDIKTGLLFDTAALLTEFCVYGSYIVGADLMLIFGGLVVAWTTAKLTVGVGIRLWELLPLT